MIGGFDLEPDKWYHKLWFYPLCLALLVGVTVCEAAKDVVEKLKQKMMRGVK